MRSEILKVSTNLEQHFINTQVSLFLFDLRNEASEHGFKSGESWSLQMATDQEVITLKRHHHPVVSMRLIPEVLLNVYHRIKAKLKQPLTSADTAFSVSELAENQKKHLTAYPVKLVIK